MKSVLSRDDAEKVAITHRPLKFPKVISASAHDFIAHGASAPAQAGSSFRLDPLIAEQSGVVDLERVQLEERVEREALLRLKEFQEQAYKEGHLLGLEEGRELAFKEVQEELSQSITSLNKTMQTLEALKVDLLAHNEKQIIELIFYIGKRLAVDEISARPEVILGIVKSAIGNTQADEKLVIKLSPGDFAFVESVKEKLGREFEAVHRARLESSTEVTSGGCLISTGFGEVNSSLEQRIEKVWTVLAEKLPRAENIQVEKPKPGGEES